MQVADFRHWEEFAGINRYEAKQWFLNGFDLKSAKWWHDEGFSIESAKMFRRDGFNPETAKKQILSEVNLEELTFSI